MAEDRPTVLILAGANGSGKTTASRSLLSETLAVMSFVNADAIAVGLNAFDVESVAFEAGRVMLARLHELAERRANFAFETTLSTRSFAVWLERIIREQEYVARLHYFWLGDPELNIARVAARVRRGGHNIPEETIRRRYERSLKNFFTLYQPVVQSWYAYLNAGECPELIAHKDDGGALQVALPEWWERMKQEAGQ